MKKFSKQFKTEELKDRWNYVVKLSNNDALMEEIIKDIDPTEFDSESEFNSCIDYLYNEALRNKKEII